MAQQVSVEVLHSHEIIKQINNFASNSKANLECPICEDLNMTVAYPRYCYLKDDPFGCSIWCNICGRRDEVVFHCPNGYCRQHKEGFDYCFECGLKHFNLIDKERINLEKNANIIKKKDSDQMETKRKKIGTDKSTTNEIVETRMQVIYQLLNILSNFNGEDRKKSLKDKMAKPEKLFSNHNIASYFSSQTRATNEQLLDLAYQTINIRIDTNDNDDENTVPKEWNNAFNEIMNAMKEKHNNSLQIFESIYLWNVENGWIENGSDLKQAIFKVVEKNNSNNDNTNNNKKCSFVIVSNIRYHSVSQTSKIVEMQKRGKKDEKLCYFKLFIHDWNVDKAIQYYEKDHFCFDYFLDPKWLRVLFYFLFL